MKNDYLIEKYLKGFSYGKHYIEIFENPSKKELLEAGGSDRMVRFFIDMKKKKVYAWTWKMTHYTVSGYIWGTKSPHHLDPDIVQGVAKQQGSKWVMISSDLGTQHNVKKYGIKKWKWTDKYINITNFMEKKAKEEYKGDIDWEFLGRTPYGEMA